ncbi:SWIM zinc finger family protein [Pimelobacter simplex]|uniref:SWIM zinc finger family protein n=1 Tax=Nocardioides simplex TaxID=2045 RepID=UPI00381EF43A
MAGPRAFTGASGLGDDGLALALAPALTPDGVEASPRFFHGFATHPQVLARGLGVLAEITATRYFHYTPTTQRDPVLTAQGDRLRAECFSACNSVYARLDLLAAGLDGGEIAHGTTNVDLGTATRALLAQVGRADLLHLAVGLDEVRLATIDATAVERPVAMPARWIRALGNVAELHHGLVPAFSVDAAGARAFLATVPAATATTRGSGWLVPDRRGVRLAARPGPAAGAAVAVAGLHRLSALRRMLTHVEGMTFHHGGAGDAEAVVVEVALPAARLVVGLTAEAWRGHSGEGSLLTGLAGTSTGADARLVSALLSFEPVIDVPRLARATALSEERVRGALAVLASSGRVGWDLHDAAWFHRELPDDPDRVERDHPRLAGARALVAAGAVVRDDGGWTVSSGGTDHRVTGDPPARCTCRWYLTHGADRGPCKHVLAVRITEDR